MVRATHTAGGAAETAYEYIGTTLLADQDLSNEDFTVSAKWAPVKRNLSSADYASTDWSQNELNLSDQDYTNLSQVDLWNRLAPISQDIVVEATNAASIDSVVGGLSGAVGGGTVGVVIVGGGI